MPTSEDDAIGEPDPEFVDTKPHASTAGPDNSLRSTTPRNTRKSKRPRVHSPLVKDEEPPVPRGPAVDEHALFGPSHPDALSLQDAPVLPSLNESTVRYVYSSFILIFTDILFLALPFVASLATTTRVKRALPLASSSSGESDAVIALTAARRAVRTRRPTKPFSTPSLVPLVFLPLTLKVRLFFSIFLLLILTFYLDLRAAMNRIHQSFYNARLSYQLAQSQHRAGLEEFARFVETARFIDEHLPPMHAIGPAFDTQEALRHFSGCSITDLLQSMTLLHEADMGPYLPNHPFIAPSPTDDGSSDGGLEVVDTGALFPSAFSVQVIGRAFSSACLLSGFVIWVFGRWVGARRFYFWTVYIFHFVAFSSSII